MEIVGGKYYPLQLQKSLFAWCIGARRNRMNPQNHHQYKGSPTRLTEWLERRTPIIGAPGLIRGLSTSMFQEIVL